jgi:hypothetical protein
LKHPDICQYAFDLPPRDASNLRVISLVASVVPFSYLREFDVLEQTDRKLLLATIENSAHLWPFSRPFEQPFEHSSPLCIFDIFDRSCDLSEDAFHRSNWWADPLLRIGSGGLLEADSDVERRFLPDR